MAGRILIALVLLLCAAPPHAAAAPTAPPTAVLSDDGQRVYLGDRLLLDLPGLFPFKDARADEAYIYYSPTRRHFLVIAVLHGFDNVVVATVMRADGTDRRLVVDAGETVTEDRFLWMPDDQAIHYWRGGSCNYDWCPEDVAEWGVVRYDLATGAKTLLMNDGEAHRRYRIIGIADPKDLLNVRALPGADQPLAGLLPHWDDLEIYPLGPAVKVRGASWLPIWSTEARGWVNAAFLAGEPLCTVVNLAPNGQLNVRSGPGVVNEIWFTLLAGQRGIHLTGQRASVGGSVWAEIKLGQLMGWVNTRYLSCR